MNLFLRFLAIPFIAVYYLSLPVSADAETDIDRAAVMAHLDQLQNVVVTGHSDIVHNLAKGALINYGTEVYDFSFSFLSGTARMDAKTPPDIVKSLTSTGTPGFGWRISSVSPEGKFETLAQQISSRGHRKIIGGIAQLQEFPEDWTIDIALGLGSV